MKHISRFLLLTFTCLFTVNPMPAVAQEDLESALADLATTLAGQMEDPKIKRIAIAPFPDLNGYQSSLGEFIAEELMTQLFLQAPGRFDVVERRQLSRVLDEQELSTTSLFEEGNIEKLGNILGIDAIVTGSIADLGEEVKINARAISVVSARVFAAASAKALKKGVVENLSLQNAPAHATQRSAARPLVQRSGVYFNNSFLRASVSQVAKSKNGRGVYLALEIENLTNSDLFIAVEWDMYQRCFARLMDNLGTSYGIVRGENGVSGLVCLKGQKTNAAEFYTAISSKSRIAAIFTFVAASEELGSLFSFAGDFLRFDGRKATRFSIGIANIETTN